ncbi:hypothetical protein Tlie_1442 [Thermovirga lienii DSM 17291]|uniref:Uncharacterized protein n=1 Tax=Thermovirga lienii (strain ATCC BAA-1197 / DSM 17291 / Cas60314) TaxID=580340 RepID=G7V6X9_THELD|nr:hypothetical protein [Thermovirga lienii]AER67168.1 hypothetical protein Tlie_1442 [Thermovirga lienii DSM 17291]
MLIEGRGVITEGTKYRPWRYTLTLQDDGALEGLLVMQGWEDSQEMKMWYELNKGKKVKLSLQDGSILEVAPMGLKVHESGHYSQAEIVVRGTIEKT